MLDSDGVHFSAFFSRYCRVVFDSVLLLDIV